MPHYREARYSMKRRPQLAHRGKTMQLAETLEDELDIHLAQRFNAVVLAGRLPGEILHPAPDCIYQDGMILARVIIE